MFPSVNSSTFFYMYFKSQKESKNEIVLVHNLGGNTYDVSAINAKREE